MKIREMIAGQFFWVVLMVALVCLFEGAQKPAMARSMMSNMSGINQGKIGIQSEKGMPASCPMQGNLPCCHSKTFLIFCQTSLCQLSTPWQGGLGVQMVRIHSPAMRLVGDANADPPPFLQGTIPQFPPLSRHRSVFPQVSTPLLI